MAKMAQLHADGVRHLHDYDAGHEDGYEAMRQEAIKIVKVILDSEYVTKVPIKLTLGIILKSFELVEEDE